MFDKVENVVCNVIGIDAESLTERTKKSANVKARHFCMLILHNEYGVSIRTLSRRYGFGMRYVFHAIAQTKYFLGYIKEYQDAYSVIKDTLKDV
jgi:hypothetical protein